MLLKLVDSSRPAQLSPLRFPRTELNRSRHANLLADFSELSQPSGVSDVLREAEEQLDALLRQHSSDPREAILQLFFLALEREELVSTSYRDSLISARLKKMPLNDDARELIRRALIWAWKDEEMHALFSRGAILKLGSARLRFEALACQAAGAIGGWAASALQHTRWREAPLSRLLARGITTAGALMGKLPKEVRDHLEFRPFRDFCLFNAELEAASRMSWQRIVQVTEDEQVFNAEAVHDFRRVVSDEERHRRVFAILAEALDDRDQLAPGYTAERLAEQIAEAGEFYLPGHRRGKSPLENPLGSGGRVYCYQGQSLDEKIALFRRVLQEAGLREQLEARAKFLHKRVNELRVAIKPTFMLGYNRRDSSTITDPVLLSELAAFLREAGCANVAVIEAPNIYDRFFAHRSVANVAAYFGIQSPHFRLIDASADRVPHQYARGMAQSTIAQTWKEADLRISFGKVRSHPIDHALLSIANLEGLGERTDEYLFFDRQASRATSLMMLLDEFPPHFALLDAYETAPDGLVGMMGCRRPTRPLRIYAGTDALAVDMVAARHLGIRNPRESSLLDAAHHWFGGWSENVEVIGTDEPIAGWRGPYSNELWALMSFFALPMYVFGSGRGLRFVPEMDTEAFPPLEPESWFLKFRRRNIRALLGLRLPRK
jgi:uncharacterized protein (DUF362 family)